jgi:hypothetical protein
MEGGGHYFKIPSLHLSAGTEEDSKNRIQG